MQNLSLAATFSHVAQWTAQQCGRASTFMLACVVIIVWAVTGPVFGYSDTWQLIINTGTTIVTFLMVFLMQNTQNRDTASIQLKLDELIRANENARNAMLSLEDMTEEQLKRIKATFANLAEPPAEVQRKLVEASEDLEAATEKVEQAQEKVLDAAESAMEPSHAHDNAKVA
jgi:low affinity Fe/Cu permease